MQTTKQKPYGKYGDKINTKQWNNLNKRRKRNKKKRQTKKIGSTNDIIIINR